MRHLLKTKRIDLITGTHTVLVEFSATIPRGFHLLVYINKPFCAGTNTSTNTLMLRHAYTHRHSKRQTVLLKSLCRQMFVRLFSLRGTLINKMHAEDQQCLSSWHTHLLRHSNIRHFSF